ncbi:helix-turn-helix domain-containing protein [Streptomyces africanus]|uniref:helix-turn-helix domain-containing protein n=1 Tax=Streptomyces africanus TaxID=231024 RepID=UPI000A3A2900|nr:helix-turn-helix domain-containing protein [Streptomyces africanus]
MTLPDLPEGARRLVREDGSVVVPPALAGEVLRCLLRDLSSRVRADGGELSAGVRELLWGLHAAATEVEQRQGSVDGTGQAGPGTVEVGISDAARRLGCSREYARRLARGGRLPARRVGRTWLVDAAAFAAGEE